MFVMVLDTHAMSRNDRNRAGRRGNSNQQRQSTSASAASRDGTNTSRRGGKAGSSLNKSSDVSSNVSKSTATAPPPQDDYVPMIGFNADAVKEILKNGFDGKATLYKPDTKAQTVTQNPQSPWGAKREST
jgi:hypothetical protein